MNTEFYGISQSDWTRIKAWNAHCPEAIDYTLHDLIHLRTQFQPTLPAIQAWDGRLTYAALDTVTTRLAHWLGAQGVQPGSRVPIAFIKSSWAVVAMIAVMKAGGAFLPLDWSQPASRTLEVLDQVQPTVLLASTSLLDRLSGMRLQTRLVAVDQSLVDSLPIDDRPLERFVSPTDPALCMYTSGSTGRPTGVLIQHRAIATVSVRVGPSYQYGPQSRVAQFAAYIWLVCANEIFTTLVWGGQVCIPSESQRLDDPTGFIRDHGISLIHATPAFLTSIQPEDVPSVQVIGIGGDRVPEELARKWSQFAHVVLGYGSTETNLCINHPYRQMEEEEEEKKEERVAGPLAGKPVGAVAWIVKAGNHEELCPIGEIGDLVIESHGLALQYLGQESKTADTFIPPPAWSRTIRPRGDTRWCKIGDKASYGTDGSIRIHGRNGSVVKVRGQRVGLPEVQRALEKCLSLPSVGIVEAIKLKAVDGEEARLVAFLLTPGTNLDAISSGLKDRLSSLLPEYMLPTAFLPLAEIPMTASGKIDRPRLHELASSLSVADLATWAPRSHETSEPTSVKLTAEELLLREMWSKILNVPANRISAHDEFFSLGGHSLSAIQLVTLARRAGVSLSVEGIFKNPHLSSMALVTKPMSTDETATEQILPFALLEGTPLLKERIIDEIISTTSISLSDIEDIYPCTSLQAGLFSSSLRNPGTYIISSRMSLPDTIDLERLERAWRMVVLKTPILRTRLAHTSAGFVQVVLKNDFDWQMMAIPRSPTSEEENPHELHSGERLTQYRVTRQHDTEPRLFTWEIHHALIDAWSQQAVLRMVEAEYRNHPATRETCHGHFSSFIKYVLQKERDVGTAQYWRHQLAGAAALPWPPLPYPRYQPIGDSIIRRRISFAPRAKGSSFTTATAIRAAWALLLTQYGNTNDVIFGATVSGRESPVPHIEDIIGPTIATSPIRLQIDRSQPVHTFLQIVQAHAVDMMPFESFGLHNIRRLDPEIAHACDFQTLLVIRSSNEGEEQELLGEQFQVEAWDGSLTYALTLECALLEDGGASCQATFDQQVLLPAQIDLIIGQLEHVCRLLGSESSSETCIHDLDLLSQSDRALIWGWNSTLPPTINRCIHDVFRDEVERHPDAVAIDAWDGSLTYRQLDELATSLAHLLQGSEGIAVEDIVPVCFRKSKWTIVAMLALWKAGGAFASIDAGHPASWIRMISNNVQAKLALCSQEVAQSFPEGTRVLVVDEALLDRIPQVQSPLTVSVQPENVAYVIHTSGSTGVPKGIVHEHRTYISGVVNRMPSMFRSRHSRALQFASYSFDVSVEDIWTTLLVGGVVCVPSDHDRVNDLVNYMNRTQVNYAELTPSFTRTLSPDSLPHLKILSLSGEASTDVDRDLWVSHVTLLDEYGPAEIAIKSHLKQKQPDSMASDKGHSVACLSWIVNIGDHHKLQMAGAVGELVLEGPILSRGYLNQPTKTREVYIDNPAWLPASRYGPRRLFRTGDLARYNPDGTVHILGRKDTQVKLRGHRIELSQVEYHARQQLPPHVEVVCELVTLESGSKNGNIVLFVCSDPAHGALSRETVMSFVDALRDPLSAALPTYMVPSALVALDVLPVNMSRKVDRMKLKSIAGTMPTERIFYFSSTTSQSKREPQTASERQLQALWAQVFETNSSTISAEDSFLERGGDSILAIKLVSLAGRAPDAPKLTVRQIFQYPVLCDLAAAMDDQPTTAVAAPPASSVPFDCLARETITVIKEEVAQVCSVLPEKIDDIYPCSPLQEGLMALSEKNPGTYVSRLVFDVRPDVNLDKFQHAWSQVYARTATLRTRIVQLENQMLQVVVRGSLAWDSAGTVEEFLNRTSDLTMGSGHPLFQCGIVHRLDSSPCLVLVAHHAIYDGWSMPLLLDQVTQAYNDEPPWDQSVPEFKQFIKYLGTIDRDQHAAYWRDQLQGAAQSTSYPPCPKADYVPLPDQTIVREMDLPSGPGGEITTLPTLLRAAWVLLAARQTDSQDVVFGATLSGRNAPVPQINAMVGPVFATVPIRVRLSLAWTVHYFIRRAHGQALEMMEFEHLGLPDIQRINADTRAACNFGTLLVMQTPTAHVDGDTPRLLSQREDQRLRGDYSAFNPYPAMLQFFPLAKDRLAMNLNFDSRILTPDEAQRALDQLAHIIVCFCTTTILRWNANGIAPAMVAGCVHDYIEARSQRHPDKIAIEAWDGVLSYGDLSHLSGIVAQQLLASGVTAEDIIPVCFEKSQYTAVAMLGVLKAGAAFSLLDPGHPIERLRRIADEAHVKIIVTSVDCARLFVNDGSGRVVITVSRETAHLAQTIQRLRQPLVVSDPTHLACLVFTSGSTGTPKGIMLQHAAICTSALTHGPALGLDENSRVLQFASHAFDMAVYDFCTTLILGGCVCIPSDMDRMNHVNHAIASLAANWAFFTPSTATLLIPDEVPSLRTLVLGGESVTQEILDTWVSRVNVYQCSGPAETTTCIGGKMQPGSAKNCLGKGLGALSWVVDPANHDILLPIGLVGEMVLEGPVLARGYLNSHDQTSAQFFTNPAWARGQGPSSTKPRRFYKTGDLVRYGADGSLLFMGRKDTQVKIRGQRVEVNEIEDCIRSHSRGWEVAVDVVESGHPGQSRKLAAFLVHHPGQHPASGHEDSDSALLVAEPGPDWNSAVCALAQHLSAQLPSYMIPAAFVPLRHLPSSTSGKVDRKALRALGLSLSPEQLGAMAAADEVAEIVVPSTPAELKMRDLWATVLHLDGSAIAASDNFFALGGDSLLAMRLVASGRRFGITLTVAGIFNAPVLQDMAKSVQIQPVRDDEEDEQEEDGVRAANAVAFECIAHLGPLDELISEVADACGRGKNIVDILPCTPLQAGLMALSVRKTGSYIAQEVYRIQPGVDIPRFQKACEAAVEAYPILRTSIVQLSSSSDMIQVVYQEGITWQAPAVALDDYLVFDQQSSIGLGDPLTRWAICCSQNGHAYFVWTKHHSSYDGFSAPLVLRHIEHAYADLDSPKASQPSPVSFATFIKHLQSQPVGEQRDYWRSYLENASVGSFPGATSTLADLAHPTQTVSHQIQGCVPSAPLSITFSNLVQAAWALVLSKHTGSSDVVFGATVSGRNVALPGVESVVGPTFTTVPVRLSLDPPGMPVAKYLSRVQSEAARMIPFQHFGLQNIKHLGEDIARLCDFDCLLVIQPHRQVSENSLLVIERLEGSGTFRTTPLTVLVDVQEGGAALVTAHFDAAWFDHELVERMLHQLGQVLDRLIHAAPETTVADIEVITDQELDQIWEWNHLVPPATTQCIHDTIQEQITARPAAFAVEGWDGRLSYALLDEYSGKVADYLVESGISRGSYVPLLFEKSVWAIVAVLAVLRAGAAFVPIDPSHPRHRVKFLLRQTESRLVLASPHCGSICAELEEGYFIVSPDVIAELERRGEWEHMPRDASSPAYISFTSGSTGEPKGAVISHSAYSSGAAGHIPAIAIDHQSRVLQFASFSFDTCFEDILTTLIVGGCICMPSEMERTNDLPGCINRYGVNWAHLTPSVASLLDPASVPGLRVLLLGGEAMSGQHVQQWARTVRLINVYGPSELCVTCAVNPTVDESMPTKIGHTVGGVPWIVDPDDPQKLAPVGAIGELVFEGPILAQGYLRNPLQTDRVFLPAPRWLQRGSRSTAGRTGCRVYRTGDLVRYDRDGSLIFHGRRDAQVKLHGQRIELGEIEWQIKRGCLESGDVRDVVVQLATIAQSSCLTAFLSLTDAPQGQTIRLLQTPSFLALASRIHDYLTRVLPYFMVPSVYVPLDTMPLTRSRKLDRMHLQKIVSAIPPEQLVRRSTLDQNADIAPRTALEMTVQEIWCRVLNREAADVALGTSFWSLGGDSISALRVLSFLRAQGIQVTVQSIMQYNTLGSFCALLEDIESSEVPSSSVSDPGTSATTADTSVSGDATTAAAEENWFLLSPIQARFFELYPDGNSSYQLSHTLTLRRTLDMAELRNAVEALVQRHPMLRARFTQDDHGRWWQWVSRDVSQSHMLWGYQDEADSQDLLRAMIRRTHSSINITTGPILAGELVTTPNGQVLHLTAHHLALDLVSWRILLEDLETLLHPGGMLCRDAPTASYQAWCEALAGAAYARSGACPNDPDDGLPPFALIPTPFAFWGTTPQATSDGASSNTQTVSLNPAATARLLAHAPPPGHGNRPRPDLTLLAILQHAFLEVFPERTGTAPTAVNVSHGRDLCLGDRGLDVSRTVGWFTTMYPTQGSPIAFRTVQQAIHAFTELNAESHRLALPFFVARHLRSSLQGTELPEQQEHPGNEEGQSEEQGRIDIPEIMFNYAGVYQQLERPDALFALRRDTEDNSPEEMHSEMAQMKMRHAAVFEIVARVRQGHLQVGFSYGLGMKHQARIREWIRRFEVECGVLGGS
ncbi:acetyl-CoA synthetase-like protein [Aspergillus brunneoviolaceus CBS 621.78]|uniref:Acetyl-CoA synthetase-like protein n=1 Tax=Aspergillus brunneoviolaceus CBS 621.78 TaxID=1450534 RepID=A0ACD1FWE5_9EURO|nr:acetyl-CoA synthetase-like protein [Aspergillus brunneoviolaceus CBS 621.78]RAH41264.1 acetyl-CoA synthetase-like protein [Aspergillus brunneoviolaceus CBS 621.78]